MTEMVRAEVITIGDEILFGQITDTNTQWISTELTNLGIRTVRKTSVGDGAPAILEALQEAHNRADLIIITGGLGPTKDDITKKTLCTYFGVGMVRNEVALELVTSFFVKRGREMTDLNRTQADLPANAEYIQNDWGTAPGMWFEHQVGNNGRSVVYVSLPGVPFEMKSLMKNRILPKLQERFETPIIKHKMIRTVGIGESFLAERIEAWEDALPPHIRLAYLPHFGQVRLRLTATGSATDTARLDRELAEQVDKVMPLIGEYVFGFDTDELETVVGRLLVERGLMFGTAESCTGGYIAAQITKTPGSSAYFQGSIVSYANAVKVGQLGVDPATLAEHGAVSEQTVRQMAEGARRALGADITLATSGIAGPDGGTPDKPVGTIWIACATPDRTVTRLLRLGQYRDQNIQLTTAYGLNMVREQLLASSTYTS
ncbi:competence/damage-inducible protein A [Rudanella paleaurantiibacter]|uniref:CinA-like protein n=1 Tax=Rudanella paleaurantiibacter TaxID=2614655 RepID=A0A7J5TUV1_9BACT|nr:competence/damage-inducible protein A [Rudanella paleaurantiibacter]KAB7727924.1 competence/damage-inducible protein A [Rudanella paleaurantiibacter]